MDTRLQHNPVYQQLNDRLRSTLGRDYQYGEKFLTEREIAARFAVSRATANKVLASLVSEGVLEFRRGIGTFVRRHVIDYDVQSLVSFTEKARLAGKKPATQLISFGEITASQAHPDIRKALAIGRTESLWEITRLRLADGIPVIFEHRYVIRRNCPKLTKSQASGSLYRAWTKTHGLVIAGADEVIRAVQLSAREARALQVSPRSPALEVVAVGWLDNQEPLWWERTLYRGDQYEFHSRLGPIRSATPARGKFRPAAPNNK